MRWLMVRGIKMLKQYILKDGIPVVSDDYKEFQRQYMDLEWIVKQETIEIGGDKYWISTVFLGTDHSFYPDGPPLLWETMMEKNGERCNYQTRCSGTIENAREMHERAKEFVLTEAGEIE